MKSLAYNCRGKPCARMLANALLLDQTGALHTLLHVPKKDHSSRTCLYTEKVSKVLEEKWASPSCLLLLLNVDRSTGVPWRANCPGRWDSGLSAVARCMRAGVGRKSHDEILEDVTAA